MPTFALEELDIPHSKIKLYKLKVNGHCEYDDWRAEIQQGGTFAEQLDSVDTILQLHAQMAKVPPGKLKELKTDGKDPIKDFEVVTRDLRVYLFRIDEGKAIVFGGPANKKQQPRDIARMRGIKDQYHDNIRKQRKEHSKK